MNRLLVLMLALMLVASMFAGCSQPAAETPPAEEPTDVATDEPADEPADEPTVTTQFGLKPFDEPQHLRIGFFTGSPLSYPFLFADKWGFFEELNITVEYLPFTNGPAMMEAHSDWDIASCGLGGLVNGMRAYGLHIIDITDYEKNLALFARPDSDLAKDPEDPENWKGTEWIYPAGTTAQAVLVNQLETLGLNLEDVTSTNMDVSNALTGFKGGTGDGLGVWNAIAFEAEDSGFIRLTDAGQQGFPPPCGTLASAETIAAKEELLSTAVALFHYTVEYINADSANMDQAKTWYYEDCVDEGLLVSESIAERVMDFYAGPTVGEFLNIFTEAAPDEAGIYTTRDMIKAERDVIRGLDFFISQGNYTVEERTEFLDEKLIDPTIANAVKAMLDNLGLEY